MWEAANRDDLFSVTSLKHYPYVANSDFHKPKHLYSWKTLVRGEKNWPAVKPRASRQRRHRADALPQRDRGQRREQHESHNASPCVDLYEGRHHKVTEL